MQFLNHLSLQANYYFETFKKYEDLDVSTQKSYKKSKFINLSGGGNSPSEAKRKSLRKKRK